MPVIPRFNKDLDYFQDVSDVNSRVTVLENNEYKVLYWASVNTGTGTVSVPTGATVVLADFPSGINAICETIVGGKPSGYSATDSGGNVVSVSSFNTSGNYTLSSTPTAYPVAVLYILQIKAKDWGNLNQNNIIAAEVIYDPTGVGVTSVALALPTSVFDVTGSPVTSTGTLTGSFKSFAQNLVLASPTSGSGVPTMRALVASDLPDISGSYLPLAGNSLLTPITGDVYLNTLVGFVENGIDLINEITFGNDEGVYITSKQAADPTIFGKISVTNTVILINGNNSLFGGILYNADFSANFTDDSLTNRLYNDGRYIKLTTKGDLATFSTEYTRLGVGTNGQVLSANSATATGLEWVNVFTNPMTTAGDLIYGGASGAPTRLPIGTRGQIFQVGASSVPSWNSNILDTNGNTLLGLTTVASAVNFWTLSNAASGNSPILSTPNALAGTDIAGIGGQIDLGLGRGTGNSGRLIITTGAITTTGSSLQTRFNLLQVANLNATNSAILINQPANNLSISTSLYTLLQGNTGLFINSPIAATSMVFRINNATYMTGTTSSLSLVNSVILNFNPSYVSAGTTGNRTSNTTSGNIRIAAAGTSATLTNSLIGSNTRVFARIGNDTTAKSVAITESVGSCVFTLNAAATAEVEIAWFIINS